MASGLLETVVHVCLMLFVPFFPAFFIFKLLPNTAVASGPFQGLRIDLTGAFAGYFLLVLLVLGYLKSMPVAADPGEMWMVTGQLKLAATNDSSKIDQTEVQTFPSVYIANDGRFTIYILRKTDPNIGVKQFPDLLFALQGHQHITVHLEAETNSKDLRYGSTLHGVKMDTGQHHLDIGDIPLAAEKAVYQ
jgi:hypothetical protein